MRHRHCRGRNAERLPWSDRLIEAPALVLLSDWERDEPLYAWASKTAHRINSWVCSRISTHLSVKASSSFSSSASDMPGGGKTFSRPSSSSYRLVVTSTLAAGQSFRASRASSVSFWSISSLSFLWLAWPSTTTHVLNCLDKCDSSTHLTLGYSHAYPSLAVIGRLTHGESRGQVVPELSRVELPSVDQFLIETGVQCLMTPFRAHKACSLPSHLRSLKHSLVQNQGTLLAMVSRLFPPLIKGGQGGFTGKARHAQRGLLNMH
jgi:hypothetical protein